MRYLGIGLFAVGVLVVIIGAIWVAVIFPQFKKIPEDYDQTVDIQGSYAIIANRDFIQELMDNPAVREIVGDPAAIQLLTDTETQAFLNSDAFRSALSDPATLQLITENLDSLVEQLSNPSLQGMLTNPEIQAILNDPQTRSLLTNPNTARLLSNPTIRQSITTPGFLDLLTDPLTQQILADPEAAAQSPEPEIQELLANETLQDLLTNPEALELLAAPETQQLLTSPAATVIIANPTLIETLSNPTVQVLLSNPVLMELFGNPVVGALLANPAMRQLLVSPPALALLGDPRAQQILASQSGLPLEEMPVNFRRARTPQRVEGNVIYFDQDFVATNLDTGEPLPQFSSESTLAVDRKTRQFVPGASSEPRRGGFAFPFDVEKNEDYPLWIHELYFTPSATYVETQEIDGLAVYIFEINAEGLTLPPEPKGDLGIPESVPIIAGVEATLKTEPNSGITVDADSRITYRLDSPGLNNPIVFEGDIGYSDETVATQVDEARDFRDQLFLGGTVVPWIVFGVGAILIIAGGAILGPLVMRNAQPGRPLESGEHSH